MNGCTIERSRSSAPSWLCVSIGRANARSNHSREPSRPGLTMSISAHSSLRRFSIGVPVIASRRRAGSRRSARARFVFGFLTSCASSSSSRSQGIAARKSTSRVAMSYEVMTTSDCSAASASAAPASRRLPWWLCTRSEGANRATSAPHCLTTLIGQTTSVGPSTPGPTSSRSEASIAIAWTVLPRPMSSARIPPTPRSPSIRSQPWPRSWNGKSANSIEAGVGSGLKR